MEHAELKTILDEAPVLTAVPDSKAQAAIEELLKHPGLPVLYGLMLGTRQGWYAMLAEAPLTNMETVARAAVIQGMIRGIETLYNTLLEQTIPSQERTEQ